MTVKELIIQRFLTLYGPPKTNDKKAFFAEYQRALGGVEPDILKAAADKAIDGHTYPSWPTIGEVVDAVRAVAEQRAMERLRVPQPVEHRKEPSPEQKARVDALIQKAVQNISAGGLNGSWPTTRKTAHDE